MLHMNTLLTISRLADRGGRFGRGHGAPWMGLIVVLATVALVASLVMWLLRRRGGTPVPATSSTSAAQAIVAERLARGEIGADEYHSLLATLRGEVLVAAAPAAEPASAAADDTAPSTSES
jgi:uncharacterized membrane protein